MKKLIFILACVSICGVGCKTKTEQNNQSQDNTVIVDDIELVMSICQSCSMPMDEEYFGTNADGTANNEYCKYCYVDGEFTQPDITMAEMIDICVPHMVEQGMEAETARSLLEETLPLLKRWQSQE